MTQYAITGLGLATPLGIGREAFGRGLAAPEVLEGEAFRSECAVLDATRVPDPLVAEVRGFDAGEYLGKKGLRNFDRLTKLLIVSAKLALEDAGLKRAGEHCIPPERIGVCSATAYGSIEAITELVQITELEDPRFVNPNRFPNTVVNAAAGYVSIWEDLRAPNVTVVDGNCGALDALLTSQTHMTHGRADAFLVGGGEALSDALYLAFRKLDVLAEAKRRYAPGDSSSQGMRLGEGAAYLCLEPLALAQARGADLCAKLLGYGSAFEPPESESVVVHASERAVERAVEMALAEAQLSPAAVDLVCASVSGVVPFDAAELAVVTKLFGTETPVAAPKKLYGETFGASGALALASSLGWMEGVRPLPLVRGRQPERIETVLVIATGFYGNVSAVVVSAP